MSSLYRMFYMFFPVITLTTNVAAVFSALIGERWMGWDQNWGIFLLLLSEALMPFSWMGSLYVPPFSLRARQPPPPPSPRSPSPPPPQAVRLFWLQELAQGGRAARFHRVRDASGELRNGHALLRRAGALVGGRDMDIRADPNGDHGHGRSQEQACLGADVGRKGPQGELAGERPWQLWWRRHFHPAP